MISRKPHKRKRCRNDWFKDWFEDDWFDEDSFWCCKKEEEPCKKKKEEEHCKKKKERKHHHSCRHHCRHCAVIGNVSHKPVSQIDVSCSPTSGCCLGFFIKISTK